MMASTTTDSLGCKLLASLGFPAHFPGVGAQLAASRDELAEIARKKKKSTPGKQEPETEDCTALVTAAILLTASQLNRKDAVDTSTLLANLKVQMPLHRGFMIRGTLDPLSLYLLVSLPHLKYNYWQEGWRVFNSTSAERPLLKQGRGSLSMLAASALLHTSPAVRKEAWTSLAAAVSLAVSSELPSSFFDPADVPAILSVIAFAVSVRPRGSSGPEHDAPHVDAYYGSSHVRLADHEPSYSLTSEQESARGIFWTCAASPFFLGALTRYQRAWLARVLVAALQRQSVARGEKALAVQQKLQNPLAAAGLDPRSGAHEKQVRQLPWWQQGAARDTFVDVTTTTLIALSILLAVGGEEADGGGAPILSASGEPDADLASTLLCSGALVLPLADHVSRDIHNKAFSARIQRATAPLMRKLRSAVAGAAAAEGDAFDPSAYWRGSGSSSSSVGAPLLPGAPQQGPRNVASALAKLLAPLQPLEGGAALPSPQPAAAADSPASSSFAAAAAAFYAIENPGRAVIKFSAAAPAVPTLETVRPAGSNDGSTDPMEESALELPIYLAAHLAKAAYAATLRGRPVACDTGSSKLHSSSSSSSSSSLSVVARWKLQIRAAHLPAASSANDWPVAITLPPLQPHSVGLVTPSTSAPGLTCHYSPSPDAVEAAWKERVASELASLSPSQERLLPNDVRERMHAERAAKLREAERFTSPSGGAAGSASNGPAEARRGAATALISDRTVRVRPMIGGELVPYEAEAPGTPDTRLAAAGAASSSSRSGGGGKHARSKRPAGVSFIPGHLEDPDAGAFLFSQQPGSSSAAHPLSAAAAPSSSEELGTAFGVHHGGGAIRGAPRAPAPATAADPLRPCMVLGTALPSISREFTTPEQGAAALLSVLSSSVSVAVQRVSLDVLPAPPAPPAAVGSGATTADRIASRVGAVEGSFDTLMLPCLLGDTVLRRSRRYLAAIAHTFQPLLAAGAAVDADAATAAAVDGVAAASSASAGLASAPALSLPAPSSPSTDASQLCTTISRLVEAYGLLAPSRVVFPAPLAASSSSSAASSSSSAAAPSAASRALTTEGRVAVYHQDGLLLSLHMARDAMVAASAAVSSQYAYTSMGEMRLASALDTKRLSSRQHLHRMLHVVSTVLAPSPPGESFGMAHLRLARGGGGEGPGTWSAVYGTGAEEARMMLALQQTPPAAGAASAPSAPTWSVALLPALHLPGDPHHAASLRIAPDRVIPAAGGAGVLGMEGEPAAANPSSTAVASIHQRRHAIEGALDLCFRALDIAVRGCSKADEVLSSNKRHLRRIRQQLERWGVLHLLQRLSGDDGAAPLRSEPLEGVRAPALGTPQRGPVEEIEILTTPGLRFAAASPRKCGAEAGESSANIFNPSCVVCADSDVIFIESQDAAAGEWGLGAAAAAEVQGRESVAAAPSAASSSSSSSAASSSASSLAAAPAVAAAEPEAAAGAAAGAASSSPATVLDAGAPAAAESSAAAPSEVPQAAAEALDELEVVEVLSDSDDDGIIVAPAGAWGGGAAGEVVYSDEDDDGDGEGHGHHVEDDEDNQGDGEAPHHHHHHDDDDNDDDDDHDDDDDDDDDDAELDLDGNPMPHDNHIHGDEDEDDQNITDEEEAEAEQQAAQEYLRAVAAKAAGTAAAAAVVDKVFYPNFYDLATVNIAQQSVHLLRTISDVTQGLPQPQGGGAAAAAAAAAAAPPTDLMLIEGAADVASPSSSGGEEADEPPTLADVAAAALGLAAPRSAPSGAPLIPAPVSRGLIERLVTRDLDAILPLAEWMRAAAPVPSVTSTCGEPLGASPLLLGLRALLGAPESRAAFLHQLIPELQGGGACPAALGLLRLLRLVSLLQSVISREAHVLPLRLFGSARWVMRDAPPRAFLPGAIPAGPLEPGAAPDPGSGSPEVPGKEEEGLRWDGPPPARDAQPDVKAALAALAADAQRPQYWSPFLINGPRYCPSKPVAPEARLSFASSQFSLAVPSTVGTSSVALPVSFTVAGVVAAPPGGLEARKRGTRAGAAPSAAEAAAEGEGKAAAAGAAVPADASAVVSVEAAAAVASAAMDTSDGDQQPASVPRKRKLSEEEPVSASGSGDASLPGAAPAEPASSGDALLDDDAVAAAPPSKRVRWEAWPAIDAPAARAEEAVPAASPSLQPAAAAPEGLINDADVSLWRAKAGSPATRAASGPPASASAPSAAQFYASFSAKPAGPFNALERGLLRMLPPFALDSVLRGSPEYQEWASALIGRRVAVLSDELYVLVSKPVDVQRWPPPSPAPTARPVAPVLVTGERLWLQARVVGYGGLCAHILRYDANGFVERVNLAASVFNVLPPGARNTQELAFRAMQDLGSQAGRAAAARRAAAAAGNAAAPAALLTVSDSPVVEVVQNDDDGDIVEEEGSAGGPAAEASHPPAAGSSSSAASPPSLLEGGASSAASSSSSAAPAAPAAAPKPEWSCPSCTFINPLAVGICSICGTAQPTELRAAAAAAAAAAAIASSSAAAASSSSSAVAVAAGASDPDPETMTHSCSRCTYATKLFSRDASGGGNPNASLRTYTTSAAAAAAAGTRRTVFYLHSACDMCALPFPTAVLTNANDVLTRKLGLSAGDRTAELAALATRNARVARALMAAEAAEMGAGGGGEEEGEEEGEGGEGAMELLLSRAAGRGSGGGSRAAAGSAMLDFLVPFDLSAPAPPAPAASLKAQSGTSSTAGDAAAGSSSSSAAAAAAGSAPAAPLGLKVLRAAKSPWAAWAGERAFSTALLRYVPAQARVDAGARLAIAAGGPSTASLGTTSTYNSSNAPFVAEIGPTGPGPNVVSAPFLKPGAGGAGSEGRAEDEEDDANYCPCPSCDARRAQAIAAAASRAAAGAPSRLYFAMMIGQRIDALEPVSGHWAEARVLAFAARDGGGQQRAEDGGAAAATAAAPASSSSARLTSSLSSGSSSFSSATAAVSHVFVRFLAHEVAGGGVWLPLWGVDTEAPTALPPATASRRGFAARPAPSFPVLAPLHTYTTDWRDALVDAARSGQEAYVEVFHGGKWHEAVVVSARHVTRVALAGVQRPAAEAWHTCHGLAFDAPLARHRAVLGLSMTLKGSDVPSVIREVGAGVAHPAELASSIQHLGSVPLTCSGVAPAGTHLAPYKQVAPPVRGAPPVAPSTTAPRCLSYGAGLWARSARGATVKREIALPPQCAVAAAALRGVHTTVMTDITGVFQLTAATAAPAPGADAPAAAGSAPAAAPAGMGALVVAAPWTLGVHGYFKGPGLQPANPRPSSAPGGPPRFLSLGGAGCSFGLAETRVAGRSFQYLTGERGAQAGGQRGGQIIVPKPREFSLRALEAAEASAFGEGAVGGRRFLGVEGPEDGADVAAATAPGDRVPALRLEARMLDPGAEARAATLDGEQGAVEDWTLVPRGASVLDVLQLLAASTAVRLGADGLPQATGLPTVLAPFPQASVAPHPALAPSSAEALSLALPLESAVGTMAAWTLLTPSSLPGFSLSAGHASAQAAMLQHPKFQHTYAFQSRATALPAHVRHVAGPHLQVRPVLVFEAVGAANGQVPRMERPGADGVAGPAAEGAAPRPASPAGLRGAEGADADVSHQLPAPQVPPSSAPKVPSRGVHQQATLRLSPNALCAAECLQLLAEEMERLREGLPAATLAALLASTAAVTGAAPPPPAVAAAAPAPDPPKAFSEALEAAFVNPALSLAVETQLADATMALCGAAPAWLRALLSHAPLRLTCLLPLPLRRALASQLSCGPSRALSVAQEQDNDFRTLRGAASRRAAAAAGAYAGAYGREEPLPLLTPAQYSALEADAAVQGMRLAMLRGLGEFHGVLERDRVSVRKSHLLRDAEALLRLHAHHDSARAEMELAFEGEKGQGVGVNREFYAALAGAAAGDLDLGVFDDAAGQGGEGEGADSGGASAAASSSGGAGVARSKVVQIWHSADVDASSPAATGEKAGEAEAGPSSSSSSSSDPAPAAAPAAASPLQRWHAAGLFPRPLSAAQLADGRTRGSVSRLFGLIGAAMGKALQDGRLFPLHLSPTLVALLQRMIATGGHVLPPPPARRLAGNTEEMQGQREGSDDAQEQEQVAAVLGDGVLCDVLVAYYPALKPLLRAAKAVCAARSWTQHPASPSAAEPVLADRLRAAARGALGCDAEDLMLSWEEPLTGDSIHGCSLTRRAGAGASSSSSSSPLGEEEVTNGTVDAYVARLLAFVCWHGVVPQLRGLLAGIAATCSDPLWLCALRPGELRNLVCGAPVVEWDLPSLSRHVVASHGYTLAAPPVQMLMSLLHEMTQAERAAFLRFATGQPVLPPGGLAALAPALSIIRKQEGINEGFRGARPPPASFAFDAVAAASAAAAALPPASSFDARASTAAAAKGSPLPASSRRSSGRRGGAVSPAAADAEGVITIDGSPVRGGEGEGGTAGSSAGSDEGSGVRALAAAAAAAAPGPHDHLWISASTCFHQVKLPPYSSKGLMKAALMAAVHMSAGLIDLS